MCPLRVILIFLSATIAGFFLIRGLNTEPDQFQDEDDDSGSPKAPVPIHSKFLSAYKPATDKLSRTTIPHQHVTFRGGATNPTRAGPAQGNYKLATCIWSGDREHQFGRRLFYGASAGPRHGWPGTCLRHWLHLLGLTNDSICEKLSLITTVAYSEEKNKTAAASVDLSSIITIHRNLEHLEVGSAVKSGFWTVVDMASGRYLWRTLVAPPAKSESDKAR